MEKKYKFKELAKKNPTKNDKQKGRVIFKTKKKSIESKLKDKKLVFNWINTEGWKGEKIA